MPDQTVKLTSSDAPDDGLLDLATERPASAEAIDYPERPIAAARGIVSGVILALPFWALVAFALYLLF
jgi:hypothetical protein